MENPLEEITLDRLFRVTKKVPILDKVYTVRSLTDLERNMRFRTATAVRSRYAAKLRDPESDESTATFGSPDDMLDDELRTVIMLFKPRTAAQEAQKIEYPFIPYPDDAKPEEIDEVNRLRQEAVDKTNERRKEFVKQYLEEAEKDLKERDRAYVLAQYKRIMRDNMLQAVFGEEGDVQSIFMSLDGQLSLEDVRGLPAEVRTLLSRAVAEVDNMDPLHLNGRASTESSAVPSASPNTPISRS